MDSKVDIAENLAAVKARITAAAQTAGRPSTAVSLVVVSKTHPAPRIDAALRAGHRVFGENRVQEAKAKWPELKQAYTGTRLHLVGPLQRNKVRHAVSLFDVIETVDRPKLARSLAVEMEKSGCWPECLVQVNTGEEARKAGVLPADADAFIASCRDQYGLPLVGLMCIPPINEEASLHFALLRNIASRNGLGELSMGMSADYQKAVHFGATLVRVGTAIFGERQPLIAEAG
ncbi:MAG TPA: YggS family pyridoxal phosphate-dependent enzyme [Rhodospirillales bacterium]|jgi:hypothetical protein|nr:YggS family pyridoxal phosphate-dependent enzyme [Rhodospirillales bacterium]|tara:strand:- start:194 stop:889 length:696 start_codon:yes stop_codon:yes gene_type:complete